MVGWALSALLQLLSTPSFPFCAAASLLQKLVGWLLKPAAQRVHATGPSERGHFYAGLDTGSKCARRRLPAGGCTMFPRISLFSMFILICGVLYEPAIAQQLAPVLPLPELKACRANIHPRLPENWRGVFLMAPFT